MGWLRWYPAPPAPPPDNLTSFLSKLSQNTRTGFYVVNLNYHLIPSHLQEGKTKCRFLSILASYWAVLVLLKASVCSPVFTWSLWTLFFTSCPTCHWDLSGVWGEGSSDINNKHYQCNNINSKQSVMDFTSLQKPMNVIVRKYISLWCREPSH